MCARLILQRLGQNWGTVVGGAILQNTLSSNLPPDVIVDASGSQFVYALIRQIPGFPVATRVEIQKVFADGLRTIWYVMIGASTLGFISCFLMKEVEMRKALDETWGLQQKPANALEIHGIEKDTVPPA